MSSEILSNEERLERIRKYLQPSEALMTTVNTFTAEEFSDLFMRSNELFIIVDCRSQYAYDISHIPHAITLEQYNERFPKDKLPYARTIFYSHLGDEIVDVVKREINRGARAYNLVGGFISWGHFNKYMDNKEDTIPKQIVVPDVNKQWQVDTLEAIFEN
ncbi:hypothetical protein WA158_000317 [Blastocystis sp. Blastoise]